MAKPNIVNVTTIFGNTAVQNVSTVATDIVSNPASSNYSYKINTLTISNFDTANTANITASLFRSSVEYRLAAGIVVPTAASLVIISKENQIYLEEGDSLRLTATANSRLQAVCSYEGIA